MQEGVRLIRRRRNAGAGHDEGDGIWASLGSGTPMTTAIGTPLAVQASRPVCGFA